MNGITQWWDGIVATFVKCFIREDRYMLLLDGIGITIKISLLAVLIGIAIGLVIAFCNLSKSKGLNFIGKIYTDVIRGTPSVTQLMIIYFVVFATVDWEKWVIAAIAFGVNSGAYVSEIVRAGILSIDKGQTEAGRSLGLNAEDYISLTSYTHHPFYTSFALEIPDNWRWAHSYNLPIDELMEVFDNAIMNGYTVAWGSDVSEDGFTREGTAILPDMEKAAAELDGSDMAKWLKMTESQRKSAPMAVEQRWVSQEERQLGYDNRETTDDHGMLIYGIAKDQKGTEYYMVKNSWGEAGTYKGIWYASKAFVRYKTMNIIVHKDAIPAEIRAKLKL